MTAQALPVQVPWRHDATTISLVGLAHGTSHFHHLLLAPMFPWFIDAYGLNYAQLGLLVTVFFVISGIGQALSGFLVDRVGARPVLYAALSCFCLASVSAALATGYGGLMLASALAGLGNSPFHPIDFTIINRRVSAGRLGHAYSVHGITGNLGWACAPLVLTGLFAATGSLRTAYLSIAVLPLLVLTLMLLNRSAIDDRAEHLEARAGSGAGAGAGAGKPAAPARAQADDRAGEPIFAFLTLPAVWLCFAFLFFSTCALAAVQSFAGPALAQLSGLSAATASLIVTGYMLCGAAGMVAGGFLLAKVDRAETLISAALCGSALLLLLVATGWLPGLTALVLASAAGLGTGLAGPSRDMLIRRASPPGATGRVYGMVYSGLDLGFALAAPLFGALLDAGRAGGVFVGSALALAAAVASAWLIGVFTGRAPARAGHGQSSTASAPAPTTSTPSTS
ncbi:MAG: MFS transporter [Burkholderiales bacterium]|nr:MFS transporter [Burkholderiales bacterium]